MPAVYYCEQCKKNIKVEDFEIHGCKNPVPAKMKAGAFREYLKKGKIKVTQSSRNKGKRRQLESELQQACVQWFRASYPQYVLFAVPNGGSRNSFEAAKLKAEGVLPGVSDLILWFGAKGFNGMGIEMKIGKNKQTESQEEFEIYCLVNKYKYVVCRSLNEFEKEIKEYLS